MNQPFDDGNDLPGMVASLRKELTETRAEMEAMRLEKKSKKTAETLPAIPAGGQIGPLDMLNVYRAGQADTAAQLTKFMEVANANHQSQSKSFQEGMRFQREQQRQMIEEFAEEMDEDGDGDVSPTELINSIIGAVGQVMSARKGGKVSRSDFERSLQAIAGQGGQADGHLDGNEE